MRSDRSRAAPYADLRAASGSVRPGLYHGTTSGCTAIIGCVAAVPSVQLKFNLSLAEPGLFAGMHIDRLISPVCQYPARLVTERNNQYRGGC
jgi:hypothetical protein